MKAVYVRKNGSITGSGDIFSPLPSLEAALSVVDSGGIIDIGPGYFHSLFLDVGLISVLTFRCSYQTEVKVDYFLDRPDSNIKISGGSWLVGAIDFPDCILWCDENDFVFMDEEGKAFCDLEDMSVSACWFVADEDETVFADEDDIPFCTLSDPSVDTLFADEGEVVFVDESDKGFEDLL